MITLTFIFIILCFGFCSLFFVWRFKKRGKWASLVPAFHALGWVLAVARELKRDDGRYWLPLWGTAPWLAAAGSVGILSVLILLHQLSQGDDDQGLQLPKKPRRRSPRPGLSR